MRERGPSRGIDEQNINRKPKKSQRVRTEPENEGVNSYATEEVLCGSMGKDRS
jgi:hypothetical protein